MLFFWGLLSGQGSLGESLYVTESAALIAAVSLLVSVSLRMWTPHKLIPYAATVVYSLLVITTSILIVQSGGIHSPFIALWLVAGVFSGLLGWWGIGSALVLANTFILYAYFYDNIGQVDIVIGFLTATLPVVVSYILWNKRSPSDSAHDHVIKTLNKNLEQEMSRSDAIIQAIGDGVIAVRQTGEIVLINPTALKMVEWSHTDAINIDYKLVLKLENEKGEAMDDEHDPILSALNRRQPVRANNLIVVTKAGKRITTSFTITPLGGEFGGAIAVFRDVTRERKEEREQAEFISTASHEMRTPVASIEGYLGLVLNPSIVQIDEKGRDYVVKAHESAQHLGHLFQDLLEVSKADDGRLQSEFTAVDVTVFTRAILESLLPQASKKGLVLSYASDSTKGPVRSTILAPILYAKVDKNHLREVITNLIENAIKYTPDGEVQVSTSAEGEYIRVTVKDSGLGVSEDDIPHLFQKFYRVDNSDTREIGGTGLGLYLCRRLIESMHGRIWVESKYGKGSEFHIELPRLSHEEAQQMLEQEKEKTTSSNDTLAPQPIQHESPTATPRPTPTTAPAETTSSTVSAETPTLLKKSTHPPAITPLPQTPSPQKNTQPLRLTAVRPNTTPAAATPPPTPLPTRENTPILMIERHPERYIRRRNT